MPANGDAAGVTTSQPSPFHSSFAKLPVHPDGTIRIEVGVIVYSTFVPPVAVFTAEWPGVATNRQVFHSGGIVTSADKLPAALLFRN